MLARYAIFISTAATRLEILGTKCHMVTRTNASCCTNRSQPRMAGDDGSYGRLGDCCLGDGIQPDVYIVEYVHIRTCMTIYMDLWPSLIVHNQASLASLFQHIIARHDMMSCDRGAKSCMNALRLVPLTSNVMDAPDAACTSSLDAGDVPCAGMFSWWPVLAASSIAADCTHEDNF